MPLILCPECNREISDKANACPQCGYPITDTSYRNAPIPTAHRIVPNRVRTTEDSLLTRNRGFGDLILYGPLIVIAFVIIIFISHSSAEFHWLSK